MFFIITLPFLAYWRLFFFKNPEDGLVFWYGGQFQHQILPNLYFWQNSIKNLDLPLWIPYTTSGYPFLNAFTIPQYNIFNLFYLLFKEDYFYNIFLTQAFAIFFLGIGGIFIYMLCLHLRIDKLSSFSAVIIYEINYTTFHLPDINNHNLLYPFFPLILLLLLKIFSTQKTKYALYLGLILGLCFFGSDKIYFYFSLPLIFFLIMGLQLIFYQKNNKAVKTNFFLIIISIIIFIGITSIELLPQIEFVLFHSAKPDLPIEVSYNTASLGNMFDFQFIFNNYLKPKNSIIGISAIALLIICFWGKSLKFKLLLLCYSLFVFIMANTKLLNSNDVFYPLIPFRGEVQLWNIMNHFQIIGLGILTSYGINNVLGFKKNEIKSLKYFVKYLLSILIICFLISYVHSMDAQGFSELQSLFYFYSLTVLGLIFLGIYRIIPLKIVGVIILLLLMSEQVALNNNFRIATKSLTPYKKLHGYSNVGYPIEKKIKDVPPRPLDYREKEGIYTIPRARRDLWTGHLYRSEFSVYGYMPRWLDSYYRFMKIAKMPFPLPENHNQWVLNQVPNKAMISLLSFSNAIDPSKKFSSEVWQDFEPKYKIPKIKIFKNAINAKNAKEAESLIQNIDVSQIVIFEKCEIIDSLMKEQEVLYSYEPVIELLSFSNNKIKLKVKNPYKTGFLFYSDNFYPGWKVYIDGIKDSVYRADLTFKGAILPQGEHILEFKFLPATFIIGLGLSVSTLVFVFLFIYKDRHTHLSSFKGRLREI